MYFKKTVTTYSGELVHDDDKNWGMHVSGCHLSDKVLMAFLHPGLPHVSRWPLPVRSFCLFELHYLGTCLLDLSVCHALYCFLDVFPMSTPNPSTPTPRPLTQLHSPFSVLCMTRYGSCKGSNCYTGITVCDLRQWTMTPQSYQPRHSNEKECWKTPSHVRWDFANERMYFERNVRFYF